MKGTHIWISREVFDILCKIRDDIKSRYGITYNPSFNKILLFILLNKDIEYSQGGAEESPTAHPHKKDQKVVSNV